jgi:hypothetical protein
MGSDTPSITGLEHAAFARPCASGILRGVPGTEGLDRTSTNV